MRNKLFGSRRRKVTCIALIALLSLGGVALAAWLVTGSATFRGKAATLTAPAFNLTGVTAESPGAYPGGAGADLSAKVTNPNPVALHVTAVTVTGATFVSSDNTACPSSNWSLDQAAFSNVSGSVPPGGLVGFTLNPTAIDVTKIITGGLKLAAGAPTGCQGTTVDVTLAANAVSWST